jgi:hypothetical protein
MISQMIQVAIHLRSRITDGKGVGVKILSNRPQLERSLGEIPTEAKHG